MSELKAQDYRRMFLEKIGFPLIRANAECFVPGIGDLRKTENVKAVFEAAMQKKAEEAREAEEKEQQYKLELEALQHKLDLAKAELGQVDKSEPTSPEEEPERQLAHYVASIPIDAAEKVLSAVFCSEQGDFKSTYRRLSKVFHPDTTSLSSVKAAELFALLRRLYEQIAESNNSFNFILNHDQPRTGKSVERKSWISKEDPDDIDF